MFTSQSTLKYHFLLLLISLPIFGMEQQTQEKGAPHSPEKLCQMLPGDLLVKRAHRFGGILGQGQRRYYLEAAAAKGNPVALFETGKVAKSARMGYHPARYVFANMFLDIAKRLPRYPEIQQQLTARAHKQWSQIINEPQQYWIDDDRTTGERCAFKPLNLSPDQKSLRARAALQLRKLHLDRAAPLTEGQDHDQMAQHYLAIAHQYGNHAEMIPPTSFHAYTSTCLQDSTIQSCPAEAWLHTTLPSVHEQPERVPLPDQSASQEKTEQCDLAIAALLNESEQEAESFSEEGESQDLSEQPTDPVELQASEELSDQLVLEHYKQAANCGDVLASCYLARLTIILDKSNHAFSNAWLHMRPYLESPNWGTAINHFSNLVFADDSDNQLQNILGAGCERDDIHAKFLYGMACYAQDDTKEKSLTYLQPIADQNDPLALLCVANIHHYTLNNPELAIEYYGKILKKKFPQIPLHLQKGAFNALEKLSQQGSITASALCLRAGLLHEEFIPRAAPILFQIFSDHRKEDQQVYEHILLETADREEILQQPCNWYEHLLIGCMHTVMATSLTEEQAKRKKELHGSLGYFQAAKKLATVEASYACRIEELIQKTNLAIAMICLDEKDEESIAEASKLFTDLIGTDNSHAIKQATFEMWQNNDQLTLSKNTLEHCFSHLRGRLDDDCEAQCLIGLLHATENNFAVQIGIERNIAYAYQLLDQSTRCPLKQKQNRFYDAGCYHLGILLAQYHGISTIPYDREKAYVLLANQTYHQHTEDDCIRLGYLAHEMSKFNESCSWFRKAGDNLAAMLGLAIASLPVLEYAEGNTETAFRNVECALSKAIAIDPIGLERACSPLILGILQNPACDQNNHTARALFAHLVLLNDGQYAKQYTGKARQILKEDEDQNIAAAHNLRCWLCIRNNSCMQPTILWQRLSHLSTTFFTSENPQYIRDQAHRLLAHLLSLDMYKKTEAAIRTQYTLAQYMIQHPPKCLHKEAMERLIAVEKIVAENHKKLSNLINELGVYNTFYQKATEENNLWALKTLMTAHIIRMAQCGCVTIREREQEAQQIIKLGNRCPCTLQELEIRQNLVRAHSELTELANLNCNLKQALVHREAILALDPNNPVNNEYLAMMYLFQHHELGYPTEQINTAIKHGVALLRGLAEEHNNIGCQKLLGRIYSGTAATATCNCINKSIKHDPRLAIQYFAMAVKQCPTDTELQQQLVELCSCSDPRRAATLLSEARLTGESALLGEYITYLASTVKAFDQTLKGALLRCPANVSKLFSRGDLIITTLQSFVEQGGFYAAGKLTSICFYLAHLSFSKNDFGKTYDYVNKAVMAGLRKLIEYELKGGHDQQLIEDLHKQYGTYYSELNNCIEKFREKGIQPRCGNIPKKLNILHNLLCTELKKVGFNFS